MLVYRWQYYKANSWQTAIFLCFTPVFSAASLFFAMHCDKKTHFSLIFTAYLSDIPHKALDIIAAFAETAQPFLNLTELS